MRLSAVMRDSTDTITVHKLDGAILVIANIIFKRYHKKNKSKR